MPFSWGHVPDTKACAGCGARIPNTKPGFPERCDTCALARTLTGKGKKAKGWRADEVEAS